MGMIDLIKLLDQAKADYVLVGGLAVALHGYARNTMDVDIVLAMNADNIQRFIGAAKAAGLQPVAPVSIESLAKPELLEQWVREKGLLAFALRGADSQSTVLDVLIKSPVSFETLRQDAELVGLGAMKIPVASIDHLITMKRDTGRSKDAVDIDELQKLKAKKA